MRHFRSSDILLFFSLIVIVVCELSTIGRNVREYKTPSMCNDMEYFDTTLFTCALCDFTRNLKPSDNRLTCVCNKFSKKVGYEDGFPLCEACAPMTTVTRDGMDCIPCRNGSCSCPADVIQIDKEPNGALLSSTTCLPCSKNTFPVLDRSKCLPCDNSIDSNAHCNCPITTHVKVNDRCFDKNDITEWSSRRNMYLVKFRSDSIDSYYFRTELLPALLRCKKEDKIACEHLSNMCILSLFANDAACLMFTQKQSKRPLFYRAEDVSSLLSNTEILQKYNLDKKNNNSLVNFTIAKVSLEGKFQALGRPQIVCSLLANVRFGVNAQKNCQIMAGELMDLKTEFFSPFLKFHYNGNDFLFALPVLVKNAYQEKQQYVNKFFIVDNVSGYKAVSGTENGSFRKESNVSALRYMKSLNIKINVQNGDDRGKIYPPILVVEYGEVSADEIVANVQVNIDYKVTFVFRNTHTDIYIQGSIAVFSTIALIFAAVKTWSYSQRNYKYISYISSMFWFFIFGSGAIGNILVFIVLSFSSYVFVLYKGQTVPHILLPDDSTEESIRICIVLAACLKTIEITGFVYQNWSIDIFLIDWEQPKNVQCQYKYDSPRTSLQKLYKDRIPNKGQPEPAKTSSEIIAAKRNRISKTSNKRNLKMKSSTSNTNENVDSKTPSAVYMITDNASHDAEDCSSKNLPISIWRTYFIANEWLKLLEERRINIILQIICILFILQVIGLQNWSLATPDLMLHNECSEIKMNRTLQYGVFTLIYTTVYILQWLTSVIFYERYITNRKQAFVDLCPVANISVFILAHNYHGYYIHGRSVHGFTDTDLPTLINDLNKEQNDLCAHRGLIPGTTDQTFIVSTTQSFRIMYDEIFRRKDVASSKIFRNDTLVDWKKICDVRIELKNFLCQFLDHCFKNEDYVIKEQYLIEKIFGIQYKYPNEKSLFLIDNNFSFNQVLLYGNEWLIATFEITIFLLILSLFENYIFASGVTILVSQLLSIITKWNGKKNLAIKSLLDERFLM